MLRPRRFEQEIDPGPVQIHARKVAFDVSAAPLHWIPGHPVASNMVGLLNVVLPAAERWFVATYNEALPLVKDPRLAEDMRGFIGQEATHADTHEAILNDFMIARATPPDPSGWNRHDLLVGVADVAITSLWAVTGSLRRPRTPQPRDRTITLRVVGRQVVAHDQNVVALTLADPDHRPLPPWHPGAHLDVHLPSGRVRQYSLCGDPSARDTYRIAVRRIPDGGGGSIEVHDHLAEGATVTSNGPRNAFPLTVPGYGSPARRFRFIAGGIGITPILPMLGLAQRLGVDWSMVYVGRSRDSIPFLDEVDRFGERITIRTDDVAGLPSADDLLGECPGGTTVYACGPAPMLTGIRQRLAGRDDVELHFERFAAPPVIDGTTFTATAASTGATFTVQPEETLLSALQRSGVPAPYSCQQGFCGTCRARILDGVVQHRDSLLTDPERDAGMMLTCVSRAPEGGHLLLDL